MIDIDLGFRFDLCITESFCPKGGKKERPWGYYAKDEDEHAYRLLQHDFQSSQHAHNPNSLCFYNKEIGVMDVSYPLMPLLAGGVVARKKSDRMGD